MMRTKTRCLTRAESLVGLGRTAFSVEEADGRRKAGLEGLREMDGPRADDEEAEAEDGVVGFTSAGEE